MVDELIHIDADGLLIFDQIRGVGNGRSVEVRPVLAEAPDEVGSGAFAGERFEDVERLRIFLLFVPFHFLFAAIFVLLHHAVLGRLEFQRRELRGLILCHNGNRGKQTHT